MQHMADDDFVYPVPISETFELRFTNAMSSIQWLYTECGIPPLSGSSGSKKSQLSAAGPATAQSSTYESAWFTFSDLVIAGGMLKLVQTITFPSPKGFATITRARIDDVFDRRYLVEYEAAAELSKFSYLELDMCRFAFVALLDLFNARCFAKADGSIMPLAKRDIRKNCLKDPPPSSSSTETCHDGKSAPGAASPGAAAAVVVSAASVQKHVRGILEDECAARWPHTPVSKSVVFTVEKDPAQPKHKPLFQATVEIMPLKKSFKGAWVGNKRDAENAAAEVAIRTLHTMKPK